jgi:hypothetical protein
MIFSVILKKNLTISVSTGAHGTLYMFENITSNYGIIRYLRYISKAYNSSMDVHEVVPFKIIEKVPAWATVNLTV